MTDITHYTAGLGKARSGMAWRGKAGLGVARTAGRNPCFIFKHDHYDKSYSRRGLARHGKARRGRAWQGMARQGKGTGLQSPVHYT